MRCLHVVASLAITPHACALTALLRLQRTMPGAADDIHDVLAFEAGDLEAAVSAYARRLYVAGGGLDLAAVLHARGYDVVHALDVRGARQVAPLVVGTSGGAFVYSGRSLGGLHAPGDLADDVLVAASDLSIVDPSDAALDPTLDVGGHLARLDLSRLAALATADGEIASSVRYHEFALREWLALLVRAHLPVKAAA
jgi:hypothetical protein